MKDEGRMEENDVKEETRDEGKSSKKLRNKRTD